ncbi:MAG: hypothetical protein P9X24_03520 [Candidatus Hatepunaea meridiana]|nr:hypothetical protein [Candidatus Hatepunaea meridiana]
MAKKVSSRSPGSLVLEIIVAFLVIVLFLAILIPKMQWKNQTREEVICQERMENIYYASWFYHAKSGKYTNDLSELLAFAERETLEVRVPGFRMDPLTHRESGLDSFQVDFYDPFFFNHYEKRVNVNYPAGRDSIVLSVVPKARYPFAPITRFTFAADAPIADSMDNRGDLGVFVLVSAHSKMRRNHLLGEKTRIPAEKWIFFIDTKDIGNCPATDSPYLINVNVKLTIEAGMRAILNEEPPETPLSSSKQLSSMVVYRMLKEADAKAKRAMLAEKTLETVEDSLLNASNQAYLDSTADSLRAEGLEALATAIYDSLLEKYTLEDEALVRRWESIRDGSYEYMNKLKEDSTFQALLSNILNTRKDLLVVNQFQSSLENLKSKASANVVEVGFVNTTADSIDFYTNPELIKQRLFKSREDKVTLSKLADPDVTNLLNLFSFEESYKVSKVDSTGITIRCPIKGNFSKPKRSLLQRIFSVKGSTNHGNVEQGDLSWSEKR